MSLNERQKERNRAIVARTLQDVHGGMCAFDRHPVHDLVWHHKDRASKRGNISDLCRTATVTKLKAELAKCCPACRTCHDSHHAAEPSKSEDVNGLDPPLDVAA